MNFKPGRFQLMRTPKLFGCMYGDVFSTETAEVSIVLFSVIVGGGECERQNVRLPHEQSIGSPSNR